jgi:16S rRNA (guanine1207-N2)-methyltransferase/23S rRNA (guanine1835-N2)-methyltransferase
MAKHIPVALLNWLEAHSEDYIQHPITRKARLMTLRGLSRFTGLVDIWQGYQYQGMSVEALPGVFGRQQLDPGAAVLLAHLPADAEGTVCDLGCGNGILSLALSHQIPGARIIATDDSELAVLSARRNATANALKNIEVRQGNALSGVTETLDWILCNPPFHDGHKELTNIAQLMFRDAARQLSPTGTLLVIANRHLPYQPMLKRLFRSVRVISGDKRFSLYRCQK